MRGRHGPPFVHTLSMITYSVRNSLISRLLAQIRMKLVLRRLGRLSSRIPFLVLLIKMVIASVLFVVVSFVTLRFDTLIVTETSLLFQTLLM